jgi:sialic acid synthase SpsE
MNNKTYVIAEMACSHEGQIELAKRIIDGAVQSGADAIQFQIYKQTERATPYHPDFALLGELELSHDDWQELADYVHAADPTMQIIACVYERGSVDFAESMAVDAYKLHTADLSNPHMVKYVAATGKRIDLSVGASTLDEIANAIGWIRETSDAPIWLMYGMQNFPTPANEVHLAYMMKLSELFELPIGYQDHSDAETDAAFWLPAAALGMGVDILEKHITHNRSFRGVDHQAALNPDEFGRFTAMVRQIEAARGISVPKPFTTAEMNYRRYAKKSIVAAHDLEAGTRIKECDCKFMFADRTGLPPDKVRQLVGRVTQRAIPSYQLINEGDVS